MLPDSSHNTLPPPLLAELTRLRNAILKHDHDEKGHRATSHASAKIQKSINNLNHYLALRQHDLRQLQDRLAELGLSSLGRCESHVLATLNQILTLLSQYQHRRRQSVYELPDDAPDFHEGRGLLEENTAALFGNSSQHHVSRIMVTLPTEAATDARLVTELLENGMDVARINCAHDSAYVWQRMIDNIRSRSNSLGRQCKIFMDLAGQKIRTGTISQQPGTIRIRVKRNSYGMVTRPTFFELYASRDVPATPPQFEQGHRHSVPVDHTLFQQIQAGDRLVCRDARGKQRHIFIHARTSKDIWLASTEQGIYFTAGNPLQLQRKNQRWHTIAESELPAIHTQDAIIRVYPGDSLKLTFDQAPAKPAEVNQAGIVIAPAQISCSQPDALRQVQVGQSVWLDDGKAGGIVQTGDSSGLTVTITHAAKRGLRLKADKGINFPNTELDLPALTAKDERDLDFICRHADIVGLSFAQKAADVDTLMHELHQRKTRHLAIVAKIETQQGIKNLPDMILQTLGRHHFGVMIARGDLAVELGGERLVEMQEEILWLCESAHVPVIWATQVLEALTKTGISTRPELTDAAMSGRAECVMLNKGPHITQAVKTLDNILKRMENHQYKKGARLRALHQWN